MPAKKLNILVIAAEVAPFAKVGGLADVVGALPKALKAMGHDVRIVMPCYKMIETNTAYKAKEIIPSFPVPISADVTEQAYVKQIFLPAQAASPKSGNANDIPVYLIGNTPAKGGKSKRVGYFEKATESEKLYTYEPEPYIFFCRAALEMLTQLDPTWKPDVLHCNDWHTGLVPTYARLCYADNPTINQAATVFTIHNLAYQGDFPRAKWAATGLPDFLYNIEGLEFYGKWSFMKGGLIFADRINTVSETYAREIRTPEYGCGLDGLLETLYQNGKLSGILNGIDYEIFDPASDPALPARYSAKSPANKAKCKTALRKELDLPASRGEAVLSMITRLSDQKGFDLIQAAAEKLLTLPIQLVLLGVGDSQYEKWFQKLQKRYPDKVRAIFRFDMELAQRIYAGSDLFLMPSRFEPCGLGQMISLRYGTIPIVRATGGLADTVQDFDASANPKGNGFAFTDYTPEALIQAVERALAAYQQKTTWQTLVDRAFASDFSWTRSSARYTSLFTEAKDARQAQIAPISAPRARASRAA